jgi:trigger factor
MRLLQKRFGSSIRDEVKGQLISECYSQAIEDQKLQVVGEPEVKDIENLKLPESGPLKFEVEVEVIPQFELPPLEGVEVIKPPVGVTDQDVDQEIERLRERFGKMDHAAADSPVKEDDYLMSDVRILTGQNANPQAGDEAQIAHQPATYIHVAGKATEYKGHVAGIIVENLGQHLVGKKVGEVILISMNGPSGHENEKIKDQPITIVVRVDRIERMELAAVDALPGHLGLETMEQLKEQIREALQQRQEREQRSAMHEQVRNYLVGKVTVELPEKLSGRQAARLLQRQAMELAYRGVPEEEIEQKIAEARAGSEEAARQGLKVYFVLDQVAKKLDIDVSEGELNGLIAMLARQQNRRPEKLRQEMVRSGRLEQLYLQLREQKTLDKVLETAKVTEGELPKKAE